MLRFNHAFKTTLIPRDARDILYILTDFWGQILADFGQKLFSI